MRIRILFVVLLAAMALPGLARPAHASVNLGLGADWIEGGSKDFNLTLGADSFIAHNLSLGGRAGVAFFDNSHNLGIPVDLRLKLHVQRIYFEGLVGPWFILDSGDLFEFHAAFGFGVEAGNIAFGLEVGKLSHATMVGLRLLFRL
jgi:hypothetical protein